MHEVHKRVHDPQLVKHHQLLNGVDPQGSHAAEGLC